MSGIDRTPNRLLHRVAIATLFISLTAAACSTSAKPWSEDLQNTYTEVCVAVAPAVGVAERGQICEIRFGRP